jgi:hypothetical protein
VKAKLVNANVFASCHSFCVMKIRQQSRGKPGQQKFEMIPRQEATVWSPDQNTDHVLRLPGGWLMLGKTYVNTEPMQYRPAIPGVRYSGVRYSKGVYYSGCSLFREPE